ncbi:MAG: trehalose-phosphatase [Deltaproteobacteria bacterium GWC2_65_14]|nr:MAG: trehalose-phosphatase [Deltaproteobacteria bacterium GWC2_65_14]
MVKPGVGIRHLWVFGFDGTLSPLVPDRNEARLHPDALELLKDLAADPRDRVAVLSSRSIEDIVPRIPVPRVFVGGGSGLTWRDPEGALFPPDEETERELEKSRRNVIPVLGKIATIHGVELEDKRWSVAVHYLRVHPEEIFVLFPMIQELKRHPGIRVFGGPDVADVQFLPTINKAFGIRRLCRHLSFHPSKGRIIYAGDDENDAVAMRWVLSRRGTAFAIGGWVSVAKAVNVDGPASLVRAVRSLTGIYRAKTAGKEGRREKADDAVRGV